MAAFSYPLILIGPAGSEAIEALVDTGASFTTVPAPLLERFGVHMVGLQTCYTVSRLLVWKGHGREGQGALAMHDKGVPEQGVAQ